MANGDTAKSSAINSMKVSINTLKTSYDLFKEKYEDFNTPLNERRQLLQEMGGLHAEILSQELFFLHLERTDTFVNPPDASSGKALSDALKKLEQMCNSTDDFKRFMDLAAGIVTAAGNHRREVDSRASD